MVAIKRFLAASDGSRDGEHAVAMASTLAQRAGGELTRLEVESVTPEWVPRLDWWTEPASANGTATRLRGLPGIEIVRHAESWGADLVVLGRHTRNGDGPYTLGQTSDTVIRRRGGISLFVPPATHTFGRALIALDGSLRGLSVLGPAAGFCDVARVRASAICVLPESASDDWAHNPRIERLRDQVDRLYLSTGGVELLVRRGDPVECIREAISSNAIDVLIVGVRRGGAPGDLGSGHIGRDLLQTAPCAVLTVPI